MKRAVTWGLAAVVFGAAGFTAALDAVAWSDLVPRPYSPLEPLAQVGSLSAERCGACHVEIFREWSASRHAAAVTDPLYQADLKHQGEPFFCNGCHAPLVEQQPVETRAIALAWPALVPVQRANPRYDAKLQAEGVTCVACHQTAEGMAGPHATQSAPHAVKVTGELGVETACERCHTLALTKLGDFQRPLMETVTEWREYRRLGGERQCVDCHMPRVAERSAGVGAPPRPGRSHRLNGPFELDFVRTAIEVRSVSVERGAVDVTLFNGTGHRLPTAEPHRRLEVALELFDAVGVVGRTAVVIERRLDLDALKETKGEDTTLLPREVRVLRLGVPAAVRPAAGARLVVDFWLWDPADPVAIAARLDGEALRKRIHESEVTLP